MNKAIDLVKLHNLCKNLVAYAKLMPETSDIKIKRIEPKKRELKLPFKK